MSTTASVTTYLLKKLWTLIAIVLVLFALLMSLLRYSLPYLNDHKDRVAAYVSDEYAVDISLDALSVSWNSSGPALVLRGVNIAKGDQSPIALSVDELFLEIDFWPSVTSLTLQSKQVVLNNLHTDIDLHKIDGGESEFPIVQALETVFLEQLSDFSVLNSRVTLNSEQTSKSFDIEQLSWLNRGNHHQGSGVFSIDDFANNSASFILDLYGDIESYSGNFYAQATDIDFSAWLNEYTALDGKLISSKGNAELRARINTGEVSRIDGVLKPTIFDWQTNDFTVHNEISAKFAAVNQDKLWQFTVEDVELLTDEASLLVSLNGNYSSANGLMFRTSNAFPVKSFLPISGLFSTGLADQLALLSLDMSIDDVAVHINEDVSALVSISDVAWQEHKLISGVSDLQAQVLWQNSKGKLTLFGDKVKVHTNELFDRDLSLEPFSVPIYINTQGDLLITSKGSELVANELNIQADFEYFHGSQFLSLAIDVASLNANVIPSWLPNKLMGSEAKRFLSDAFSGEGNVESASVLWHGKVSEFPFESADPQNISNGIFQSKVNIKDADFRFSKRWPQLKELDAQLLFENKSLHITGDKGKLGGVNLSELRADIASFSNSTVLTISAEGETRSSDLTTVMLDSMLADSLGRLLDKDLILDGDLRSQLNLYIPLSNANETRATGKVFLQDTKVTLPSLDIVFEKAKGVIHFDNEAIELSDMSAELLNQDITANVSGVQNEDVYELKVNLLGDWKAKQLATYISEDFSNYFSGSSAWDLNLDLFLQKGDFVYDARLKSDLTGAISTLPAPFNKSDTQSRSLSLRSSGNNTASSIELEIEDVAKFDGALPHKEKQFNRAHLSIGPTEFESRGVGFSISSTFDTLDFTEWQHVVEALTSKASSNKTPILQAPQRIFVDAQSLSIFGETLNDVDMRAKRLDSLWDLDIDANEVRTTMIIHDDLYGKGLEIDAEYIRLGIDKTLKLSKDDTQDNTNKPKLTIDPKTLPSIDITCRSCNLYGVDLGRLEIEAEPNSDGLKVNQVLVNNKFGSINASGQWYKRNQDHFTFLAGDMYSSDFGEFVKLMGFDSGVQDSEANLSFALTWKDSPFDASFEHLDGQIDWRLTDGYLTEVSDKGSRIFTLLSLNSLVRKLSLDFRDVFAKGFFYDDMRGSLQIIEGIADTRDTKIDGAAGEIEIYGYTDLAEQTLNYNVSFAPNVTGNLPVLVYFFTVSPPSALAALALDQVLTSTKVISNVNYSVTGTFAEPILIETGRESTEVELPARRDVQPQESEENFVPPSTEDLIDIQVDNNGQSD